MEKIDGRHLVQNRDGDFILFLDEKRDLADLTGDVTPIEIPRLTPELAKKLSCRDMDPESDFALFHDGCAPWVSKRAYEEYTRRLAPLVDISTG